jgi:hypothetical protein
MNQLLVKDHPIAHVVDFLSLSFIFSVKFSRICSGPQKLDT